MTWALVRTRSGVMKNPVPRPRDVLIAATAGRTRLTTSSSVSAVGVGAGSSAVGALAGSSVGAISALLVGSSAEAASAAKVDAIAELAAGEITVVSLIAGCVIRDRTLG